MRLIISVGVYQDAKHQHLSRDCVKASGELTQQRDGTRIGRALGDTDKNADDIDLLCIVCGGQCHGQAAPHELECRQPDARTEPGDHDLGRDEEDAIADVEVGKKVVELVAVASCQHADSASDGHAGLE